MRVAVAGGVLLTTGAAVLRYHRIDEQPYQVYKAPDPRRRRACGAGRDRAPAERWAARPGRAWSWRWGCMVAMWIPVTSQTLQASDEGATGFRPPDVEMGRAIDALPPGSTVLAEGAAPDERVVPVPDDGRLLRRPGARAEAVGLGSTSSFLSSGGLPEWRPAMPWTHVLTTRPQPVASPRATPVWTNGGTTGSTAAPALDVTTYGLGWYPPEDDGRGGLRLDGRRPRSWSSPTATPPARRARLQHGRRQLRAGRGP